MGTPAQTPPLPYIVKLSCLKESSEALLKTDSVTDSVTNTYAFIVKAWIFTKNRLHHSLKLKTDSITESAIDTAIATPR